MSYIRVDNNVVTTAGMVHPNPSDDSWFEYGGPIPQGWLMWDEQTGTVVVDHEAGKESLRAIAKDVREEDLLGLTHTLTDGSVIQVRPQDYQYLSLAIQRGLAIDWVLEDNTVRLTSIQELTEALDSGLNQGVAIWSTYTEVIKDD